ncbi:hypothetical protein DOTSEDRAFT_31626 [Dothistroma septosporum NZE10]|uniref:Uncharacterized protein n=1 Tax=Dothistroma septosporum (strain NZE10 / CBS 128990) TaxID=675120 RepID=N1PXL7_DOTSN|nr:hypothetical protein DOTSEDRAFT_31626 [Dothistroma septosporum NZE10]
MPLPDRYDQCLKLANVALHLGDLSWDERVKKLTWQERRTLKVAKRKTNHQEVRNVSGILEQLLDANNVERVEGTARHNSGVNDENIGPVQSNDGDADVEMSTNAPPTRSRPRSRNIDRRISESDFADLEAGNLILYGAVLGDFPEASLQLQAHMRGFLFRSEFCECLEETMSESSQVWLTHFLQKLWSLQARMRGFLFRRKRHVTCLSRHVHLGAFIQLQARMRGLSYRRNMSKRSH